MAGELDYEPLAAPKLNIVAIQEALGTLGCFGIVEADDGFKARKMPVWANHIRAVLRHSPTPKGVIRRSGAWLLLVI
jgi:hypothetical protein